MPIYPSQLISKYAGRIFTDGSRYIRGHMRALFRKGQQLWDDELNNNAYWWSWWSPQWAYYRRDYPNGLNYPYIYDPFMQRYVMDPKFNSSYPASYKHGLFYYVTGMKEPIISQPIMGNRIYVVADRMVVFFNGTEWKPMFRLPQYDKNFELAAYAMAPKKGKAMFRHVVTQAFKVYQDNEDGRVRGWPITNPDLEIYKNGVKVGRAFKKVYNSGVKMTVDTQFDPGDILEVRLPSQGDVVPWVAISIVGGFV